MIYQDRLPSGDSRSRVCWCHNCCCLPEKNTNLSWIWNYVKTKTADIFENCLSGDATFWFSYDLTVFCTLSYSSVTCKPLIIIFFFIFFLGCIFLPLFQRFFLCSLLLINFLLIFALLFSFVYFIRHKRFLPLFQKLDTFQSSLFTFFFTFL